MHCRGLLKILTVSPNFFGSVLTHAPTNKLEILILETELEIGLKLPNFHSIILNAKLITIGYNRDLRKRRS